MFVIRMHQIDIFGFSYSYLVLEKFSKHFEIDDPNMIFGFLWISKMTRMRLFFHAFFFRVFYLHIKI